MSIPLSKGITFALAACFIWGLIFVVPQFMEGFSPIEIAIGRYFVYGTISSFILFKSGIVFRYPLKIWLKAIPFSLVCSFGYYIFVVLSLRYSTPAICTLILGLSPIVIAFYGNWKHKECTHTSLILPSLLILVGLLFINIPHIMASTAPSTYLFGLLCAFLSMLAWSWYVVANSAFLKRTPEVNSSDWATLIGVCTLFWVAVFILVTSVFLDEHLDLNKYITPGPELVSFAAGCAVLGILCSWVGGFLWNKASLYLPVAMAGQLTIFETIFGLCFVYLLEQSVPPMSEIFGVIIMLTAIVYAIRSSDSKRLENKVLNPHKYDK